MHEFVYKNVPTYKVLFWLGSWELPVWTIHNKKNEVMSVFHLLQFTPQNSAIFTQSFHSSITITYSKYHLEAGTPTPYCYAACLPLLEPKQQVAPQWQFGGIFYASWVRKFWSLAYYFELVFFIMSNFNVSPCKL